ncbi:hypothetical protein K7X08_012152 [Anisodus acutangulus]|uniref:Uncharacterized protein n=1 Tax=Anisodus acutangulus TaxID=402998 RepID=A0A9Q1LD16_9SOLA|nr:hypothetical protein K7X08_012152 [Anisodus acutangulus]
MSVVESIPEYYINPRTENIVVVLREEMNILGRGPHFPTLMTMLISEDYLKKKGKGVVDQFTLLKVMMKVKMKSLL